MLSSRSPLLPISSATNNIGPNQTSNTTHVKLAVCADTSSTQAAGARTGDGNLEMIDTFLRSDTIGAMLKESVMLQEKASTFMRICDEGHGRDAIVVAITKISKEEHAAMGSVIMADETFQESASKMEESAKLVGTAFDTAQQLQDEGEMLAKLIPQLTERLLYTQQGANAIQTAAQYEQTKQISNAMSRQAVDKAEAKKEREKVAAMAVLREEYEQRISVKEIRLDQQKRELAEKKMELGMLRAQHDTMQAEFMDMERRHSSELGMLRAQHDAMQADFTDMERRHSSFIAISSVQTTALFDLKAKATSLLKKLESKEKHVKTLEGKIESGEKKLQDAEVGHTIFLKELQQSEETVAKIEVGEQVLADRLANISSDLSTIVESNTALEEEVSKLSTFKGFFTLKMGKLMR